MCVCWGALPSLLRQQPTTALHPCAPAPPGQGFLFAQLAAVYALLPSVAHAYEVRWSALGCRHHRAAAGRQAGSSSTCLHTCSPCNAGLPRRGADVQPEPGECPRPPAFPAASSGWRRHHARATRCPSSLPPQALALIDSGRFKGWRAAKAPGLAASYYGLPARVYSGLGRALGGAGWRLHARAVKGAPPFRTSPASALRPTPALEARPQEGALMRDAIVRMRADEACIHHVNAVFADLRPGDRWAPGWAGRPRPGRRPRVGSSRRTLSWAPDAPAPFD